MGKEADLLFTVSICIPIWLLEEHEPLTVDSLLPIVSRR